MDSSELLLATCFLTILFIIQLIILARLSEDTVRRIIIQIQNNKLSKLLLYPILAPGVIIHEISHALACYMVGGKVAKIVPFRPKQQEDGSWQFGYVNSMANNFIQHSIIALAPLWLGPILLWIIGLLIIPDLTYNSILLAPFSNLDNEISWQFLLWAFLLLSFSLSNFPSSTDLAIARPLLYIIFLLLAIILIISIISSSMLYIYILLALNILILPSCLINLIITSGLNVKN